MPKNINELSTTASIPSPQISIILIVPLFITTILTELCPQLT